MIKFICNNDGISHTSFGSITGLTGRGQYFSIAGTTTGLVVAHPAVSIKILSNIIDSLGIFLLQFAVGLNVFYFDTFLGRRIRYGLLFLSQLLPLDHLSGVVIDELGVSLLSGLVAVDLRLLQFDLRGLCRKRGPLVKDHAHAQDK